MRAKTKIIATIGPASDSPETLARLVEAGVRIFRLNFSHGDASKFVDIIKNIRELESKCGFPISIMQDLSGPKIRIGAIEEGSITFSKGGKAYLGPTKPANADLPFLPFDNMAILKTMDIGDRLVLADGTLQFHVTGRESELCFIIETDNAGIVTSRKGLALPDKSVPLPALTDKDKKDLRDGLRLGVDAVALSFVQTARDIQEAKAIIRAEGRDIPVVAKLERKNAVDNLEEILNVTDIVMVARGDLGVECPLPLLPAMQKRIINACNKATVPVIVATQMLLSMVNNPTPTRAETTDVANAVLDGADCVMLSEETAMGNYPVEAVEFMGEIAGQAERYAAERRKGKVRSFTGTGATNFLTYSACRLAEELNAAALVSYSLSGYSARAISSQRPGPRCYAISPYAGTLHALNFSWGITPCPLGTGDGGHLEAVENFIDNSSIFEPGATVVITAGQARAGDNTPAHGVSLASNLIKVFTK